MLNRVKNTNTRREQQKRSRSKNTNSRNKSRKRYYTKHRIHARNKCRRWTTAEEVIVEKHEVSDVEIAKQLGRSVQAIQIKRLRVRERNLFSNIN